MRPFSETDRHDFPRLIDEFVPCFATDGDDFVIGVEYPIGKRIITYELQNVFEGVKFGRPWREGHDGDVVWDYEVACSVPPRSVDDQHGMGSRSHLG
mgnify:CR=1 FL=1